MQRFTTGGTEFHFEDDLSGTVIVTYPFGKIESRTMQIPLIDLVDFVGELLRRQQAAELRAKTSVELLGFAYAPAKGDRK